jgi:hypothetical protein
MENGMNGGLEAWLTNIKSIRPQIAPHGAKSRDGTALPRRVTIVPNFI